MGSQTWVQQGDGSWVATQAQVPDGDPLSTFAAPKTATTLSSSVVEVSYDPTALGLSGSDPVTVQVTFGSAGQVTMTYTAQTAAGAATSTTVFSPLTDRSPILAPGTTPGPTG